ncbi:MAG: DUF5666 domain-containing protein [Pseudohongiellaceae bacterium]
MKFRLFGSLALICAFSLLANAALAKEGEIKFTSTVISVSQSDSDVGAIEVTIHDIVVPIIVNGDTELEEAGEEISLADLTAGAFVRIDSFFSAEGLVAEEVNVVDQRGEQFRFRGELDAVDQVSESTVITLLGVDVTLVADTDITHRGTAGGNKIPAADLSQGDLVNVSGTLSNGILVASRVHVGTREQGAIELEGNITAVADSQISIAIEGGSELIIFIDEQTSVVGDLAEGVFVEAEGQLQSDLSLLAFEIVTDEDGDGDADDDNRRGERGDENSNRGRGNGGNDDDDSNDDNGTDDDDSNDDNSDSRDEIEVGAEIILRADGVAANGKAKYSFEQNGSEIEQELEIELEDAASDTDFALVITFGDTPVELGTFTSNSFGELEVELRANSDDREGSLGEFIPEGLDIRDITGVQMLLNGDVILEGDFS